MTNAVVWILESKTPNGVGELVLCAAWVTRALQTLNRQASEVGMNFDTAQYGSVAEITE